MSLTFKLALRNVTRQYGRTTLSMVSVIAGVAVIIAGRGFIGGVSENLVRAQVDSLSGHVVAMPADYPTAGVQHPVDGLIELPPATRQWLGEHAVAWTQRVMFSPRAVKGRDAVRLRAYGFDPATDEAVFPRDQWRVDGRIPSTRADGVLVSASVARVLGLEVGGTVLLEQRTSAGALNALELPVAGIVRTGNPVIDRLGIFVPKGVVDELVRPEGRFSHLCVRLADRDASDAAAAALRDQYGGAARVRTWYDEAEGMLEVQQIRQRVLDFLALALLAVAAAGIANTVLMAAYERVREIGTLRAMGMTRQGVVLLFMLEGFIMGVAGSLLGAALGAWIVQKYARDGIDLSGFMEAAGDGAQNLAFTATLYLAFSWSTVVVATITGVVIAVGASVYPAVLASRLEPADAVRA